MRPTQHPLALRDGRLLEGEGGQGQARGLPGIREIVGSRPSLEQGRGHHEGTVTGLRRCPADQALDLRLLAPQSLQLGRSRHQARCGSG